MRHAHFDFTHAKHVWTSPILGSFLLPIFLEQVNCLTANSGANLGGYWQPHLNCLLSFLFHHWPAVSWWHLHYWRKLRLTAILKPHPQKVAENTKSTDEVLSLSIKWYIYKSRMEPLVGIAWRGHRGQDSLLPRRNKRLSQIWVVWDLRSSGCGSFLSSGYNHGHAFVALPWFQIFDNAMLDSTAQLGTVRNLYRQVESSCSVQRCWTDWNWWKWSEHIFISWKRRGRRQTWVEFKYSS